MSAQLRVPVSANDHRRGPADAPVVLVEYGDYQCPHCARAHPLLEELGRRMGDSMALVFRNFPLTEMHEYALHAAEAAESVAASAGEHAFWAMHDALFEHQRDSSSALADRALADRALADYATRVGARGEQVTLDLANDTLEGRVQGDFTSGVRSGVNGTPTFFINGERFDGNWTDVDAFTVALQRAAQARVEA